MAAVCATAGVMLWAANAPATIEEQRARLPPPATCTDPVEGEWRGLKYEAPYGNWFGVSLEIHRTQPGGAQLTGNIVARIWYASGASPNPPQCVPGVNDRSVIQPANGFANGLTVNFGGTSWRLLTAHCGRAFGGYNPDRFSGTIDPAIQEFQSVNNDGGRAVNDPMVFRRVRCFDGSGEGGVSMMPSNRPAIVITPPFMPPARGGCSRGER